MAGPDPDYDFLQRLPCFYNQVALLINHAIHAIGDCLKAGAETGVDEIFETNR